jgi:hypothetical protein
MCCTTGNAIDMLIAYEYLGMKQEMAPLRRELLAHVMHPSRLRHLSALQLL